MTVADAIVDVLRAEGCDRIFGIPAGYFFGLLPALDRAEFEMVPSRHEGGAVFAAAGFTMATGKTSVCVALLNVTI